MKNRYQWILKRAAALMVAFMLTLSILPAATAASDLGDLQITVSWVDGNGETRSAEATLIEAEEAGENCFWVLVPADAPLNGLTFSAVHPSHEYEFSIGEGETLSGVTDAGTSLDAGYVPVTVTDPETGSTEDVRLFVSTRTDDPVEAARQAAEVLERVSPDGVSVSRRGCTVYLIRR